MAFNCGNCRRDNVECNCPDGPLHLCKNCGLEPSCEGSDDCFACTAAYLLTDPTQMALIQRLHAGTDWLRKLNVEVNRQLSAVVAAGRMCA